MTTTKKKKIKHTNNTKWYKRKNISYAIIFLLASLFIIPIIVFSTFKTTSINQNAATNTLPQFQHVFLIIFENKDYGQVIGNASAPYFNQIVNQYAVASNYKALMHPSLPNYILLNSGNNQGITSDCLASQCGNISADNIAHQLETAGKTWKAYIESMTTNCQTTDSGEYAQKHNPFVYFSDIASSCSANDVPYSSFQSDLNSGKTANYNWITPNLINDMHDGTVQDGNTWLANNLPMILNSNAYKQNGLVIITFDEDSNSGGNNQVGSIFISNLAKKGYKSTIPYDHYSLLRTLEDIFGLSPLGNAAGASDMSDLFTTNATISQGTSAPASIAPTFVCGGSQNCISGMPTITPATSTVPSAGSTQPSAAPSTSVSQNPLPSPSTTKPGGKNTNIGGLQGIISLLLNLFMKLIEFLFSLLGSVHHKR